ncbi:MAG: sulfatase/phosphatase domain-containing protein, partial [Verrucomicrobiota bacterium]
HYYESGGHGVPIHFGVTDGREKLIRFDDPKLEIDAWEFYDLLRDPNELRSEYNNPEYAPKVRRLERELERLQEQYGIPGESS